MARRERIETLLQGVLNPAVLELRDDSAQHSVPAGSESHWSVVVVAAAFEGKSSVARHRVVYGALKPELGAGMHALKIEAFTPSEWAALSAERGAGGPSAAPPCHGGSKHDS